LHSPASLRHLLTFYPSSSSSFARNDVRFTHIFASPLSRAFRTAQAVRDAQPKIDIDPEKQLEIEKVDELIERHFGFYEGKPFNTRADEKQAEKDRATPGFVDVESKEAMAKRVDSFLDQQLLPLLEEDSKDFVVAVVAHGMLLANFWRRLLLRLPRQSLVIAPEIAEKRSGAVLEYLGGWSNTGYMELSFQRPEGPPDPPTILPISGSRQAGTAGATVLSTPIPPRAEPEDAAVSLAAVEGDEKAAPRLLSGWSTTILAIDSTIHLLGLKRQRGGIGSLAHDEGQRKLDSFFKKPGLT